MRPPLRRVHKGVVVTKVLVEEEFRRTLDTLGQASAILAHRTQAACHASLDHKLPGRPLPHPTPKQPELTSQAAQAPVERIVPVVKPASRYDNERLQPCLPFRLATLREEA